MHKQCIVLALCALAAREAAGHGPQIQLTADTGKITTRRMFYDEPYAPLQPVTRIYVLPLTEQSGQWLVTPPNLVTGTGPGLAVGLGFDSMNPGAHPFQSGTYTVGFADGLKKWDGASFVDAGSTQFRINKNAVTADTTDASPFGSISWNINVTNANAHSGLGYRFLGDGVSPTSPLSDGIYLATFEISHGSLTTSDPHYFVLPKNADPAALAAAVSGLASARGIPQDAIQAVVPEPGALALAAASLGAFAMKRRRRR